MLWALRFSNLVLIAVFDLCERFSSSLTAHIRIVITFGLSHILALADCKNPLSGCMLHLITHAHAGNNFFQKLSARCVSKSKCQGCAFDVASIPVPALS